MARKPLSFIVMYILTIISNLVNLKNVEQNAFLTTKPTKTYNRALGKLVNAIKKDDPSFSEDYLEVDKIPDIVFVESKMNNERIKSQSGAFIIFKNSKEINVGDLELPYKDASGRDRIYHVFCFRATIPSKAKKTILKSLDKMNINEKYIYQDISHSSKYIKDSI